MKRLVLLWVLVATPASAQLLEEYAGELEVEDVPVDLESPDLREAVEDTLEEHVPDVPDAPVEDPVPVDLPSGTSATTSVGPQAIPLPSGEGSIEGMGESFTPVLSSGTGTFSVPIATPAGRAGVGPSLGLGYSTSGGNGPVGFGWGIGASCLYRQSDRGLPRYVDGEAWHPEEDGFIYDGGHELIPIDTAAASAIDGGVVPAEFAGWQQYRARIEGVFLRFFRAPDGRRWVVQGKDGARYDLGALVAGEGAPELVTASRNALQSELSGGEGRIFGWCLTRSSDAHGNTVLYRYRASEGQRYLDDIHYVAPASCGEGPTPEARRNCTAPLSDYLHRVQFVYEDRADVFDSYASTWRITTAWRLSRVEIFSALGDPGARSFGWRYLLRYDESSFHSLLTSVQLEGRPNLFDGATQSQVGELNVLEASVGEGAIGDVLSPMRFSYSETDATSTTTPGFGGFNAVVHTSSSSPPVSVDGTTVDLADVNGDGLTDVIATDPARHRIDGGPAMGVYFNGFLGGDASPGEAGGFSDAIGVALPDGLSHIARLSNANFVPMDIDGDGRGDFLHMPRTRNYGYFAITRGPDDASVRPSVQDWRLTHVPTTLPEGFTDPRVDFGSDSTHLRTIDVNNDHLVDIVRTAGTRMQTWLNLGWLPEGDGRFGSATFNGESWTLSPEPINSCLLNDGRPFDFEDPEARLADMNGDGLLDLVRIRRGRVVYWPGRDVGLWGEGGTECDAETTARTRHIEMESAPAELNPELDGVMFLDVNADGASDVVQVRFDAVDVWYNRAGHGFTPRVTANGTPFSPSFLSRVRVADLDGSGTSDLVYANADRWRWISPAGLRRPRLLTAVDNGLGALTTFAYGSSTEDYLADLHDADGCTDCERFTWSAVRGACDARLEERSGVCAYRSGASPVVSTVVRSTTTSDRFDALGREAQVSTTRYAYHNAYYEGIEQEFRGFGAADAIVEGDANHPTSTTRTFFYQGRRPNEIATDRLADNPYEALKGRAYLSETFDDAGRVVGTTHTTWALRTLLTGLEATNVVFAYAAQSDNLTYDHAPYAALADTWIEVPAIRLEGAGGAGASVETREVAVRADGWAHTRTTIDEMDDVGHALTETAHGRIRGEFGETPSEAITSQQIVERLADPTGWLFASTASWTVGAGGEALGLTAITHNPVTGDPELSITTASLETAIAYEFLGDADGSAGYVQADQNLISSVRYDSWGNTLASCGGGDLAIDDSACLRYGEVEYDEAYALFPTTERTAVSREAGAWTFLASTAEWDQGLGKVVRSTDPNGLTSEVGYDGFGRTTFARSPSSVGCEGSTVPNVRVQYELTNDPATQPVSLIRTITELSCDAVGADTLVSVGYVDGAGRARAALSTGDEEHEWVVGGHQVFDAKGSERRTYQPAFLDIAAPSPAQVVALPAVPFGSAEYDAFGRVIRARAPDGVVVGETHYHALSQDACDANDLDATSLHVDTCATARVDGHGRGIDQVLRNRQPGALSDEVHRLLTEYRNDGAVTRLVRAETVSDAPDAMVVGDHLVERRFFYDTAGRRLSSTDPDTDSRDPAATDANRTWRYLFNRVGDMVAVRDPRGCGQNFYYDHAGRLLGEAYVACDEAQAAGDVSDETVPASAIALGEVGAPTFVDVRAFYDAYPDWAVGDLTPPPGPILGAPVASSDRGQRSVVAFDNRGNPVWSGRQIAVIPQETAVPTSTPSVGVPDPLVGAPMPGPRAYDADHTYVRTAAFDFADRPLSMELPIDPDWSVLGGMGAAPVVGGRVHYGRRGLVVRSDLVMDGTARPVVAGVSYLRDGLTSSVEYGDAGGTTSTTFYDARRRPVSMRTERTPTGMVAESLSAVTAVTHQRLIWDGADNLIELHDLREASEWPDGFRPQTARVLHDALYRVAAVDYEYSTAAGWSEFDNAQDWRAELEAANTDGTTHRGADPMRTNPAESVSALPSGRVVNLTYTTDWLANSVEWTDDESVFYERSIGDITNGSIADGDRPAAMRLSTNLPDGDPGAIDITLDRGGWVTLDYGESGNVVAMTVRGQCRDIAPTMDEAGSTCFDDRDADLDTRRTNLEARCRCDREQHYEYVWDEVGRLNGAFRRDRNGVGDWTLAVRQRYRYDGGFQRVIKETIAVEDDGQPPRRATLYVYPGDFERRGVEPRFAEGRYEASVPLGTETQYMVSGARVVWKNTSDDPTQLDRDHRITLPIANLIQSTSAV
ncbi:MAG: SpvB/TcaC N-terminal domain-containing protein, partial [Myxococcota bacterium]